MFSISKRGVYGLSALIELAQNYEKQSTQIRDIAQRQDIPQNYLEQILLILRKAQIVDSFRGVNGGYALARSPEDIRILEVLSLLEGKLAVIPEQERGGTSLAFFWLNIEETLRSMLDKTLADLVHEVQKRSKNYMYTI